MPSTRSLLVATILLSIFGCDDGAEPTHQMSAAERERASQLSGYWRSTDENQGFFGRFKDDGTYSLSYGATIQSIRGRWWLESSPDRLVLQRDDGKPSVSFQVLTASPDALKLKELPDSLTYTLERVPEIKLN